MNRHYFVSGNLDELENISRELESKDITALQTHVLTLDDAALVGRGLHQVPSFMKSDAVRSALKASLLVILVAYLMDLPEQVGWLPFIFLAVVLMGFITWEGGMWGVQEPNAHFKRFQEVLAEGKYVFYVEVKEDQESALKLVIDNHPDLEHAGTEAVPTDLVLSVESGVSKFAKWGP